MPLCATIKLHDSGSGFWFNVDSCLEVIKLEYSLQLKIKLNDWLRVSASNQSLRFILRKWLFSSFITSRPGLNLLLLCLCLMCGIGWALSSSTSGVFVCLFFAYFKGGGGRFSVSSHQVNWIDNLPIMIYCISNTYTMGCPPVRGDSPRALASGLSYVQVDKHGITIYTTYISVDLAHHNIFRAKVGKGGIS